MNEEALSESYFQRANIRIALGKYEEAIADYDRAIDLKPDLVTAYNGRGIAKGKLGQRSDAVKDYDQAIRLDSAYARAYYNRGNAKRHLERYEEARADLQHALELAMEQGDEKVRKAAQERLNESSAGNSHENTK